MQILWAEKALTEAGWAHAVRLEISAGRIVSLTPGTPPTGTRLAVLLPAPANLHSHAFQRAMAGLSEARGPEGHDSFWTWRQLMFRFLDRLTPADVEAISARAQMEMLEAGFAAVGEFHYLHHQPGGAPYDNLAEMAERIVAATQASGIGLCLAPVLYQQGGCDGRPLGAGQIRFGNDPERFARLFEACRALAPMMSADSGLAVAPHSLRAVSPEALREVAALAREVPLHMHVAEQAAEVAEVSRALGERPVAWLLGNHDVSEHWCLVHATQMTAAECTALARSGAVTGLCPITEASLGDGIFDAPGYLGAGGRFGIGTDSNIRISLAGELRMLEYSQRLEHRARAVLAQPGASSGRAMLTGAARAAAVALGRDAGTIAPGRWADLLALANPEGEVAGDGDQLIDHFVFSGSERMISDVWSAGRHLVKGGRHIAHDAIVARYRKTIAALKDHL